MFVEDTTSESYRTQKHSYGATRCAFPAFIRPLTRGLVSNKHLVHIRALCSSWMAFSVVGVVDRAPTARTVLGKR